MRSRSRAASPGSCALQVFERCNDRKIDVGFRDLVHVVRPSIERHVLHDLDDLRVVVTGGLQRPDVAFLNMAALVHDLHGETHGRRGFRIVRGARAVRGELRVVELRDVFPEIRVRRQTVGAAVRLGDCERDPLLRGDRQRSTAERFKETDVASQRGRAVGDEAKQIRRNAELALDRFEQRSGGGGRGIDRGGDRKARHEGGSKWVEARQDRPSAKRD
jgi:hypothetical protein